MIAFLKGTVEDIYDDTLVLDVNGIGYNVKASSTTIAKLSGTRDEVKVYTYLSVKEDSVSLFGFLSKNELELFIQCIGVSGIGPKAAISILSVLDVDSLRFAIMSGDAKAIAQAPGVGKKIAERLILELKDKIQIDDTLISKEASAYSAGATVVNEEVQEAIAALVSLGYGQTEAKRAVTNVPNADTLDSGTLLRLALKNLY